MNWKDVKDDYPKAWKLFCDYFKITIGASNKEFDNWSLYVDDEIHYLIDNDPECGTPFKMRNLYDFFDQYGVYIDVDCESVAEDPHWTFTIDVNGVGHEGDGEAYLNRIEAESTAYPMAFKELENVLNIVDEH